MAWTSSVKSFGAVIITGGSFGIGTAFIRTLRTVGSAALICNLSRSISDEMQVNDRLVHRATDLSRPEEIAAAATWAEGEVRTGSKGPVLLINNAGFGHYGVFGTAGHDDLGMIDLNVKAVVDLTARLLPLLRERGGWIVNIASLAGFQPVPYMATYAATKAFVLHWSLALNEELRGTGVRVLAVSPGPTESQFYRRAGFAEPPNATPGQTADAVVEETFRALHRGRSLVVTGWRNRWVAAGVRLLSKPLTARIGRIAMQKLRLDQLTHQTTR